MDNRFCGPESGAATHRDCVIRVLGSVVFDNRVEVPCGGQSREVEDGGGYEPPGAPVCEVADVVCRKVEGEEGVHRLLHRQRHAELPTALRGAQVQVPERQNGRMAE